MHLRVDNGMIRRRGRHALFVLVLAFLITGCASGGDVLVPPRADVAGIQVVVVFPFMNNTNQIGLEDDVVDRLVAGLQAVGWYEVVSRERVSEALAQHRASSLWEIGDNIWLDIARDIAAELGADGFIVGSIIDYSEDVTIGAPYAVPTVPGTDADSAPPEWRVDQSTQSAITLEARLISVHTGDVVYERQAIGIGRVIEPRMLTWSLPSEPPASVVPSPHRRDISRARELAVEQAFAALTQDILPQVETTPDETDDATAEAEGNGPAAEAESEGPAAKAESDGAAAEAQSNGAAAEAQSNGAAAEAQSKGPAAEAEGDSPAAESEGDSPAAEAESDAEA